MTMRSWGCLGMVALLAGCNGEVTSTNDGGADGGCPAARVCGSSCCATDELCHNGSCYKVSGSCANGSCPEDARCLQGKCVSWELFSGSRYDGTCTRAVQPGAVPRPQLQCAWEAGTAGTPAEYALRHTPVVARLKLTGPDDTSAPSLVIIGKATYSEGGTRICQSSGTVIVLDGRTCKEQFVLDGKVLATVTPAIADLDGDGRAEIVAAGTDGGLVAFGYDSQKKTYVKLWQSTDAQGQVSTLGNETCLWGGITIADLDGGQPEIFFHGAAHDSKGKILASLPSYQFISWGNPMVVVDMDLDGKPEVVEGFGTYEYVKGTGLSLASGWVGTGGAGFVAVADFGDFSGKAGDAPGRPEVVVVNQTVRVQTILGEQLFSASGGTGTGGPPTVADFDGDKKPEIGVAFGDKYVVYDLACKGTPAGCAGDGILWTQPSQDKSSAKTGSSVFDFNGDGRAEVVYGDECFVRVYDGPTGKVIFSQGRFSSTWQENAVVVDVDGDSAAEIVLSGSGACVPTYCGTYDESFTGLPCKSAADCPGGGCDSGYCRCTSDTECGGSFSCTTAPSGTPGSGDVCRTKHEGCSPGLRIYRDANDRWAGSRSVWNQHAYYVTNVEENGSVKSVGQVKNNWQEVGLNNFRQNVQGKLGPLPAPDLTVKAVTASCSAGQALLGATVCNRGATAADSGVQVVFTKTGGAATTICTASTKGYLDPGACETVTCKGAASGGMTIQATVNPKGSVAECQSQNNSSLPKALQCVQ